MRSIMLSAGAAVLTLLIGCGATTKDKSNAAVTASQAAATTPQGTDAANGTQTATTSANAIADTDLQRLVVLGPNDLALKILAAFGRGMTLYSVSSGNNAMPMDYLTVNSNLFTGAISDTPYSTIPDTLGVPYFMAVSALSQIVGNNYAAALATNTTGAVANDCSKADGAANILRIAYPAIQASDIAAISPLLVKACQTDGPAKAAQAVIQSYAFLNKGTL